MRYCAGQTELFSKGEKPLVTLSDLASQASIPKLSIRDYQKFCARVPERID